MHIAKTAGSYLNAVFAAALGQDGVVEHAEVKLQDATATAQALARGVRFISGHIYLGHWERMLKDIAGPPVMFTVLREPVDHLASHIRWLDHYNAQAYRDEYRRLGEETQRLVDLIGVTDLSNVGALDHLLTFLPLAGVQLLDNCQARYFLCGGQSPVGRHDPLTLAQSSMLQTRADRFDLILRQDALDDGIAQAAALTGLDLAPLGKKVNPARSTRQIDTQSPMVRAVLGRRTLVDQWLWRHIRSRTTRLVTAEAVWKRLTVGGQLGERWV